MSDSLTTPSETDPGRCPGLGEVLSAYLDNEVDSHTRRSVEQHLQRCRRCSVEAAELRQVKRFLAPSSALAPGLPAGLAERVRSRTYGSHTASPASRSKLGAASDPNWRIRPRRMAGTSGARAWLRAPIYVGGVALLLLAIAILSALWANPFEQSRAAAATLASLQDHAMCEHLGQVPQSLSGDEEQVRAQLASVIGMSLAAPRNLPQGFRFAGGRAFRAGDVNSAHLAWMEGADMLSFYQASDPGGDPPAGWRSVQLDGRRYWLGTSNGESAVLWREGGVLYLLSGRLAEADMLQIALSINTRGTF